MPLEDVSVDVVISNIAKSARVLRPGGRFAISDVIANPDWTEPPAST